ncbi:CMD domain protein [Agrococcus sp. SL85]|uniref:CMD domain protein n=1 Tax=Agrococcus sp. SL85 TaxID=2995141 RepID=UPI00226C9BC0|nr:CMD domain protein [Agrococcus sp. SL85]WAC66013.1 CMD domain protein [Agrococcus sp. SL85]
MPRDVIDHLAGVEPGAALDRARRARSDAREHAQQSFLALLEPAEPGGLALADRYAVAAYVALLHDEEGAPSRAAAFYVELLEDEAEAPLVAAVRESAEAGRARGPYGTYREPLLAAESEPGPVARIERGVIPERLAAALEHAHLLVLHPRDARPESLRALVDAGWEADAIVSLSQLVAFLAFQLRLVHGLRVLGATPAASDAELEEARA